VLTVILFIAYKSHFNLYRVRYYRYSKRTDNPAGSSIAEYMKHRDPLGRVSSSSNQVENGHCSFTRRESIPIAFRNAPELPSLPISSNRRGSLPSPSGSTPLAEESIIKSQLEPTRTPTCSQEEIDSPNLGQQQRTTNPSPLGRQATNLSDSPESTATDGHCHEKSQINDLSDVYKESTLSRNSVKKVF
jgi:hypothetical protein